MFTINNRDFALRFDISRFINPVDNKFASYFDITDSEFLKNLKSSMEMRSYTVVHESNRPDLLSEKFYGVGNTEFWWILMIINNLRLPSDVKTGMVVYYPSLRLLEDIYSRLINKNVDDKLSKSLSTPISTSTKL